MVCHHSSGSDSSIGTSVSITPALLTSRSMRPWPVGDVGDPALDGRPVGHLGHRARAALHGIPGLLEPLRDVVADAPGGTGHHRHGTAHRWTAPVALAAAATAWSRRALTSSVLSVRSSERKVSRKASDFLPSPTWSPR